jgi:hypothetical protein
MVRDPTYLPDETNCRTDPSREPSSAFPFHAVVLPLRPIFVGDVEGLGVRVLIDFITRH